MPPSDHVTDPKDDGNGPNAALLAAGPDPHSYSRPDQVRVRHVGLNWVVDFDAETLTGDAILLLDRKDPDAALILDSRDLDIKEVYTTTLKPDNGEHGVPELAIDAIRSSASWAEASYEIGPSDASFGAPITIELPPGVDAVKLTYATRPGATGLQWLAPAQTAGKKAPFLYSQSQAIHARSWIPGQDSPGVRTTWDAIVVVDKRFTAVMAAEQLGEMPEMPDKGKSDTHRFRFVMPQPVPAYLIALAAGEIERREIGPRTAVYADPAVVEVAANEFADMEKMLESAEGLYGDYAWGRYDVLVLPPAFPFGGMENPRLTFVTPTLLAGDRSLVAVIAHELAHSWSGNLVTNRTWGDLWLNEGFTVYFERRIVEHIFGAERASIEAVIGKRELIEELTDPELLGDKPEFQKLAQDLRGIDPDESFSSVPYEKGALLLQALELAYGREVFDEFLRAWFSTHAFGTVATSDFIDFVGIELSGKHPVLPGQTAPNLAEWIDGVGLPKDAPEPVAPALDAVEAEANAFARARQDRQAADHEGLDALALVALPALAARRRQRRAAHRARRRVRADRVEQRRDPRRVARARRPPPLRARLPPARVVLDRGRPAQVPDPDLPGAGGQRGGSNPGQGDLRQGPARVTTRSAAGPSTRCCASSESRTGVDRVDRAVAGVRVLRSAGVGDLPLLVALAKPGQRVAAALRGDAAEELRGLEARRVRPVLLDRRTVDRLTIGVRVALFGRLEQDAVGVRIAIPVAGRRVAVPVAVPVSGRRRVAVPVSGRRRVAVPVPRRGRVAVPVPRRGRVAVPIPRVTAGLPNRPVAGLARRVARALGITVARVVTTGAGE